MPWHPLSEVKVSSSWMGATNASRMWNVPVAYKSQVIAVASNIFPSSGSPVEIRVRLVGACA